MREQWKQHVCTPSQLDLSPDTQTNAFPAAVDEIQSEQPGVFGPSGGYARALSMSSVAWTLGKFLGPIVSGFLSQGAGYYDMCSAFGESRVLHGRQPFWMRDPS